MNESEYGQGSTTYEACGGLLGITKLVSDFYNVMYSAEEFIDIKNMHKSDIVKSKDKLTCFLSGWMGGENLYVKKYGSINIPQIHAPLKIGNNEGQLWLQCMTKALQKQDYPSDLIQYLTQQFCIPIERIKKVNRL